MVSISGIEALYVNLEHEIDFGLRDIAKKFGNLNHKDTGVISVSFVDETEKMFELLGTPYTSIELDLDDVSKTRLSKNSWSFGLVYANLKDMSVENKISVLKMLVYRYNKLTMS